ncbi:MAG: phospholipase A [Aquabacterium sp.]
MACYDRRFGRATGPVPETPVPGSPDAQAEGARTVASPAAAPAASAADAGSLRTPSALSQFWELEKPDKRGTFRVLTYRPNFLLPFIVSDRVNREPATPTHAADDTLPAYRHLEAMVQVSLRVKLAQEVLLPGADLWFGYTHRAQWQVWTGQASRPFRNTDYEPQLMYVVPVSESLRALPLGWRWRMVSLGVAHQSNGQTDPLSRSWNRFEFGVGLEKDNFTLEAQVFRRMRERYRDDNPDLTQYIGRGEVRASWLPGRAITTLTWRTNLRDADRGSWQVDWSYPVAADQPQGLRWYVRGFQGYGESLLDYNFRKVSLGAGVMLINF